MTSWVRPVVSAFVLWCFLALTGSGQVDQEVRGALGALTQYQSFSATEVDAWLSDVGFTPFADRELWDAFPAVRKVEAAFQAAEDATFGGGQRFLALLSRALAQKYEAVRHETALLSYLSPSTDSIGPVSFTAPVVSDLNANILAERERNAILAVSRYASNSGPFGGVAGVLTWHFGVPDDRAYEILRSSGSPTEALERGYSEVMSTSSRAAATQRLSRLVKDVESVYSVARAEEAFAPFRAVIPIAGGSRSVALIGRSNVTAQGGGDAASAARRAALAARYNRFVAENYAQPATRAFGRMVARGGGFGGVIFGAEVSDLLEENVAVEHVIWSPGLPPGWGRLLVVFNDSTLANYGPIRESDLRTARKLLEFDGAKLDLGDGVGLVSLDNPSPYWQLDGRRVRNVGRQFDVVLHPALINDPLGRAAVMVDALPVGERLLDLVESNVPQARESVQDLMDGLRIGGTWKFMDRPTWITREGSSLRVWTAPDSKEGVDGRFLELRSFSGYDAHVQVWEFSGEEADEVTFDLESDEFDPQLRVSGPGLDRVLFDDDGGDGTDARLGVVLPASGTYRVLVSSYLGSGVGGYALSARTGIEEDTQTERGWRSLAGVEHLEATGRLIATGVNRTGTLAREEVGQVWEFTGRGGDLVTFELESAEFDAYLYVLGPGLENRWSDDDGGEGTDARIALRLPITGEYRVVASSFAGEGEGRYTLAARQGDGLEARSGREVDELSTEGRTIRAGDVREGTLASGEVGEAWEFTGREGESVTFELASEDFDAYLYVSGPGLETTLRDDDGGEGTDSTLNLVLPRAGTYRVIASSFFGGGAGAYVLSVRTGSEGEESLGVGQTVAQDERDLLSDTGLEIMLGEGELSAEGELHLGETESGRLSESDAYDLGPRAAVDREFAVAFDALIVASEDFSRLNDFARAFSLVRWIDGFGASWLGWPDVGVWMESDAASERIIVPERLAVTESSFVDISANAEEAWLVDVLRHMTPNPIRVDGRVTSRLTSEDYVWESRLDLFDSLAEVWHVDVNPGERFRVRVTSTELGVVAVRVTGPGLDMESVEGIGEAGSVELRVAPRREGVYYIVVEDLEAEGGAYALEVAAEGNG